MEQPGKVIDIEDLYREKGIIDTLAERNQLAINLFHENVKLKTEKGKLQEDIEKIMTEGAKVKTGGEEGS